RSLASSYLPKPCPSNRSGTAIARKPAAPPTVALQRYFPASASRLLGRVPLSFLALCDPWRTRAIDRFQNNRLVAPSVPPDESSCDQLRNISLPLPVDIEYALDRAGSFQFQ